MNLDGPTTGPAPRDSLDADSFPDGLGPGSTLLIAGTGDPTQYAAVLRALRHYGVAGDAALVVTTTESADGTIATFESVRPQSGRPSLGIVDTTSEHQYVTAVYEETPVVFTPSSSDLERLVLAVSDLRDELRPSTGTRHLAVRSLTPLLVGASTDRVCTVLDRLTGVRSGGGRCLLGLDYTAHDRETMRALTDRADGVLWVREAAEGRLAFEFRTAGRYDRSRSRSGND